MARALSLLLVVVVGAAWLITLPRLHLTTAITHFLPDIADKRAAVLAKSIAEGELSSTLVLDLSGDEPHALAETAQRLVARLRIEPETRSVRSGFDDDAQRRVLDVLSRRPPTALLEPADLEDDAIIARLGLLKARLGSPMGPFVRELARTDPLGGVLGALDRMSEMDGGHTSSREGVLFTADEKHAFVFAVTRASAFDAPAQRAYLERIADTFRSVRTSGTQRLETSGLARMTVASEAQIRGDIERIGGLSTVGIALLFALLFRSPRMLGLGLVPLWFGSAVAIVASHLVFGEIHGLTLAFGTSLLGVGIDYAEHYFSHFSLTPEKGADRVMSTVWPGLWMGAVTTIIGFSGLGLTGFPGVRQIAFFSTVAIASALLGTRWLLPPWMPATYERPRVMARLASWTERVVEACRRRRWVVFVPAMLVLAFVPGMLRTRFIDDVSVLLAMDPELVAEDARVRDRVSPVDPGRFVIVVRQDEEEALDALHVTTEALEAARRDGVVDGYAPLGTILRSRATQNAAFERAKAKRDDVARLLREQGFVADAFAPFFQALDRKAPDLLTLAEVRASPLGDLVGPLCPRLPEGQAFVIPLRGVRDVSALRARLPGAVVIDEAVLLESTYRQVRRHTMWMLLVGLGLIAATLALRYRSPSLVLAALLPGALGAVGAVSVAGLFGTPLNLLHFIGLLLVLSMGVDYGIFVVEGREGPEERAHSLVSIATATSTTLLSFGLLALSPSPALRALGTTITVGLLLAALLSPVASVVVSPAATRKARET
ncbi:MAG TPA: MMPL family transporter [Labilithrix sp.]|nr:MMPL family transporter [Labilithrix sp.]